MILCLLEYLTLFWSSHPVQKILLATLSFEVLGISENIVRLSLGNMKTVKISTILTYYLVFHIHN